VPARIFSSLSASASNLEKGYEKILYSCNPYNSLLKKLVGISENPVRHEHFSLYYFNAELAERTARKDRRENNMQSIKNSALKIDFDNIESLCVKEKKTNTFNVCGLTNDFWF